MPCYHPVPAWRTKGGDITLKPGAGVGFSLKIPCGNCIGCRMNRSRDWAIRCVHEAQLHKYNAFITLTYNDEHLPGDRSLNYDHFALFMKRLRQTLRREDGKLRRADRKAHLIPRKFREIRYYHCGEYGDELERPHYHAIIFGYDFPDKKLWKQVRGNNVFTSAQLTRLWGLGFCSIGAVTFQSAAYVARYVMKKQGGSAKHYEYVDPNTGEVTQREPEYTTMSLKPGIGAKWYYKFKSDIYPNDFVVIKGKEQKTPRFYDCLYERENGEAALDALVLKRLKKSRKYDKDQTPERLAVREKVAKANLKILKRVIK